MHVPHSSTWASEDDQTDDNDVLPLPPPRLLFGSKTSIFLLGSQGTGKSTLGIIASVHLGRRLVDFESYFQQQTGTPWTAPSCPPEDSSNVSSEHCKVLESLISSFPETHVVVCPTECLRLDGAKALFKRLAQTSPVILVSSNLVPNEEQPHTHLPRDLKVALACSNYNYFNISEECHGRSSSPEGTAGKTRDASATVTLPTRFLHLKRLEQEFVRFLGRVFRTMSPNMQTDTIIDMPLLLRNEYTYMLPVSLAHLLQDNSLCRVVDDGVDAIELKFDIREAQIRQSMSDLFESVARGVTRLRRVFDGPIIYHVQFPMSEQDVSVLSTYRHQYLRLVFYGLRLGVDYLTIDLRCSDLVIQRLITVRSIASIIGHLHQPQPGKNGWQSQERLRQYNRAKALGCQVIRLTQVAESQSDNLAIQHFIHSIGASTTHSPSLIAYNTGALGRTSCCFNNFFTPVRPCRPWTLQGILPNNDQSGELVNVSEAQRALFSSFFLDPLRLYIVGTDVSKSFAPLVYDVALQHLGIPHNFSIHNATSATDLEPLLHSRDFGGASLAQGFKVSILPLIQHLSVSSKVIGAVNTIIPIRCEWSDRTEDGAPPIRFWRDRSHAGPVKGLYGENTDWIGMYRCVRKRLSPVNAVSPQTTGLVLGAGGMARAAVYAMIQMGVRNIFVHNRTKTRAVELANYFNSLGVEMAATDLTKSAPGRSTRSPRPWTAKVHVIDEFGQQWPVGFAHPTIIISCVRASPGTGQPTPNITLPLSWLKSRHGGVVVDTGYEPLISPLVAQMHQEAHRGWITVDGFHILPEQAAAQFELITGRRAPRLRMSAEILKKHQLDLDPRTRELVELRLRDILAEIGLDDARD